MLLNGGELDGARVLSEQAVKAMTTNALPPDVRINGGDEVGSRAGTTFGLGFAIRADPVQSWIPGAVGSFSWAGLWGTYFWIDPAEKLIGLQMIQATPGSKGREALLYSGINHLTYGALSIPEPASVVPAAMPMSAEALADFVGSYDFGASVSSRDRQWLADGKTGWLGIGAFVAMEQAGLRINKPNSATSPATRAGVRDGDLITEIDGVPLKGLALDDVLARLRGPANTTIGMKIVHKGQDSASDISVVRAMRRTNAVQLQLRVDPGRLVAEATGAWPILAFEKGRATPLIATSANEFSVDDEDHTRIAFVRDATGKVTGLILDPGRWELKAAVFAPGAEISARRQ
jgi:hypothetical protein